LCIAFHCIRIGITGGRRSGGKRRSDLSLIHLDDQPDPAERDNTHKEQPIYIVLRPAIKDGTLRGKIHGVGVTASDSRVGASREGVPIEMPDGIEVEEEVRPC
jgi:hypothetical protein